MKEKNTIFSILSQKIIVIFFILAIVLFYVFNNSNSSNKYSISTNIRYSEVNFALENMPISNQYFFTKERFDREYLPLELTMYQTFLYEKRANKFFPYIEKQLKKHWIPDDFKYLATAESALKISSVSHAWAAWIWQIMPWTAKDFWLIVNDEIDERYHFEKSTETAIEIIKYLNSRLDNWTLTAAAYNRWLAWLQRAMYNQNAESYYDLTLNPETARYVYRILAIKYSMEHDSYSWEVYDNPKYTQLNVWKIDDLKTFIESKWYNYNAFKLINPWILGDSLPEWEWKIKALK